MGIVPHLYLVGTLERSWKRGSREARNSEGSETGHTPCGVKVGSEDMKI